MRGHLICGLALAEIALAGHVHFQIDKAVASHLTLEKRDTGSSPVFKIEDTPWYYLNVTIGDSPPQRLSLRLDSSPYIWVPWLPKLSSRQSNCTGAYTERLCKYAEQSGKFDPKLSATFVNNTDGDLYLDYGSSNVYGVLGNDTVSLNQVVVENQVIGLATNFSIAPALGLGISESSYPYNSFIENLAEQGKINSKVVSIFLGDVEAPSGDVYFGAIDTSKFTGELQRIKNDGSDSVGGLTIEDVFWEAKSGEITSLTTLNASEPFIRVVGSATIGVTSTRLPSDMYYFIVKRLDVSDSGDGFLTQPCSTVNDQGSVIYTIEGRNHTVPVRNLFSNNIVLGGSCTRYLALLIDDDALQSFELGDPFLRSTYIVYDYTNNETLLAPAYLNDTLDQTIKEVGINGVPVTGTGIIKGQTPIPPVTPTPTPLPPTTVPSKTPIAPIIGGVVGGLGAVIFGALLFWWFRRSKRERIEKAGPVTMIPPTMPPPPDSDNKGNHNAAVFRHSMSSPGHELHTDSPFSPVPPYQGYYSPTPQSGQYIAEMGVKARNSKIFALGPI
ncbi:hypothetical protein H072_5578 [Dactylellina haptotyla CBS 200.50]|uniref:Peptidase A1 domain-containing protein n=1 Tax=Dactylellina haptotyla (strain CBS 200.50) TaxID=1284197 RepID=S8BM63_DACHA|nr:hypothetical protein H072_5578 [Dactylellina haptotyla CBS 200.50]